LVAGEPVEEDYFSDFSDEDFKVEQKEERTAYEIIQRIKEKLENPEIWSNILNFNTAAIGTSDK